MAGMLVDKTGTMRDLAIGQGYVPKGCKMDGHMIMAFVNGGDDPCVGCNEDRSVCGGRKEADKNNRRKQSWEK
jgi:hypothetical protein